MKRLSTFLFVFTLTVGMIAVTGCDSTNTASSSGDGSLSVKFTDSGSKSLQTAKNAHGEKTITSAVVTIADVEIVAEEDSTEKTSVLPADTFKVDLIDLQNGIDAFLSENGSAISAGTYSQLRLSTPENVAVTFEDESTDDVMIASEELKVNFDPITIDSEEDRAEITLDFDVQDSLHGSAQGRWVITPVVNATATVTSDTTSSDS